MKPHAFQPRPGHARDRLGEPMCLSCEWPRANKRVHLDPDEHLASETADLSARIVGDNTNAESEWPRGGK